MALRILRLQRAGARPRPALRSEQSCLGRFQVFPAAAATTATSDQGRGRFCAASWRAGIYSGPWRTARGCHPIITAREGRGWFLPHATRIRHQHVWGVRVKQKLHSNNRHNTQFYNHRQTQRTPQSSTQHSVILILRRIQHKTLRVATALVQLLQLFF